MSILFSVIGIWNMKFLKIFIVLVGFSILAVLPSMNPFEESESESCSLKNYT